MNRLLSVAFTTAFLSLLSACTKVDSGDLKDDVPYYQSYSVSYNKTDNATYASASFRVRESNGARVKLTNGATITANGKAGAATNPFDVSIYTWQFDDLKDVNFTLSKPSATLDNEVRRLEIGDISFAAPLPASISKATGYTLSWAGDERKTGEHIYVSVSGRNAVDTTGTATNDKEITGTNVRITASDLQDIAPGSITITLRRERSMVLDAPDGSSGGEKSVSISVSGDLLLTN
ncbi:MAG: hypothetical protein KF744_04930 [Taibaiella sp.]|nr:hypothetical protein [Taibaiella sp.]